MQSELQYGLQENLRRGVLLIHLVHVEGHDVEVVQEQVESDDEEQDSAQGIEVSHVHVFMILRQIFQNSALWGHLVGSAELFKLKVSQSDRENKVVPKPE